MLIDTHLHIVDRKALTYPWLAGAGSLNRDAFYADYATEARRVGITATLHMEVDVAESDIAKETAYVKTIAAGSDGKLIGAIAACRPENHDFAAYLETVKDDPFIKGLRRILHESADDLSESPAFRANIKRLEQTRLTFDICALPRQHRQAAALIDHAPDVTFVMDHCGVPDIKGKDFAIWSKGMTEIARRPNVLVKISGIMAYTDRQNWTLEDLRPYVDHCIESFGWDRLVWGSDYPVCTLGGSLSTWVAATHALIEGASWDEKSGLLGKNAMRLWGL